MVPITPMTFVSLLPHGPPPPRFTEPADQGTSTAHQHLKHVVPILALTFLTSELIDQNSFNEPCYFLCKDTFLPLGQVGQSVMGRLAHV